MTFYQLVLHLQREHRWTVFMVSHELQLMAHYADLVLCLNRRLVCQWPPQRVLQWKHRSRSWPGGTLFSVKSAGE